MAARLELRDVGVRFGTFDAVDGVSLKVHAGEVVGLIGPNGAGKTVTFNVVTGLQPATRGAVLLDGVDVTRAPAHARTGMGLARTFQVVQLFAGMTVLENLMVAAHRFTSAGVVTDALRLPGRRRALAAARERASAVLAFLGLQHLSDVEVSSLPVGQARLVELARALCLKPKVLLLDEPASGLDPAETADFVALLAEVRATLGCAMLLVEHDMGVVMPLCDHLVVMNFGRVLASGRPADVRDDPEVKTAYLGTPA
ncbi:MAG: transporter related protein [Frankiales bacterium]|jgi:branched-chain amino acid transport system ATP-binding protein|nr:transporter related protein [Frankiales bacterium]